MMITTVRPPARTDKTAVAAPWNSLADGTMESYIQTCGLPNTYSLGMTRRMGFSRWRT